MRDSTTQGKILIFNSLAISKVVYLALIKTAYFYCKTIEYYKKTVWQEKKKKNPLPYATSTKMMAWKTDVFDK